MKQLQESFDSPHELTDVTDQTPYAFMLHAIHGDAVKNVKVHSMGDTGDHILTLERDGNMEVHHVPSDQFSLGKIVNHTDGPNMRFVSTAIDLAKDHVAKGGTVRIVATPETIEKFHGIAKRVAARNGAETDSPAKIDDPEFYGAFGQTLSAFKIGKKK